MTADPVHQLRGPWVAEPVDLAVDVDQAAGVGDEVGRVEDPARAEIGRQRVIGEHVVRRPADDPRRQNRHRVVVQGSTEGTGGVYVEVSTHQRRSIVDDRHLREV